MRCIAMESDAPPTRIGRRPVRGATGRALALRVALLALALCPASPIAAAEATVAVASNFLGTARALTTRFEANSDHSVRVVSGSTGTLFAQIVHGAPFDVFLAADLDRPEALVARGLAIAESARPYAEGRLVLLTPARIADPEQARSVLASAGLGRIALANPALAPYGRAARETLESLGVGPVVRERLVIVENVAQVFALVATGNVGAGFVARAQIETGAGPRGAALERWSVPRDLHPPILQGVVLLERARENAAARAFLSFLSSEPAQRTIRAHGYEVR